MKERGVSSFYLLIIMTKKILLALSALAAFSSGAALAQEAQSPWLLRARAVNIDTANKDSTGLNLSLSNKTIPEVDVSYFFTPNIAAELILTYPQKHNLYSNGTQIGTLKHLPPTLTAQYHFTDLGAFKPYVGAGINYTRFSSVNLSVPNVGIESSSWGPALQVGMDYALDKNWSLNMDLKKVYMKTDVYSAGNKIGTFKVDPVLFGLGVGYRF